MVTVLSIVLNTSIDRPFVTTITFPTIDSSNAGGEPLAGDDPRVDVIHPKPEGCLEGDNSIVDNYFRLIQTIKANASTCCSVVVIPCDLKRASSVVFLIWIAWPCSARLTIGCFCNFLYVAKIYKQQVQSYLCQASIDRIYRLVSIRLLQEIKCKKKSIKPHMGK